MTAMKPAKKAPAKRPVGQPPVHGVVSDTFIGFRVPGDSKVAYQAAADKKDKSLSVWAVETLDKAAGVKR
jgi:hypothetical protein